MSFSNLAFPCCLLVFLATSPTKILKVTSKCCCVPLKCQVGNPMKPSLRFDTPMKFNIGRENGWLEEYFPFGMVYFQGLC